MILMTRNRASISITLKSGQSTYTVRGSSGSAVTVPSLENICPLMSHVSDKYTAMLGSGPSGSLLSDCDPDKYTYCPLPISNGTK